MPSFKRFGRVAAVNIIVTVLLLAIAEGTASLVLVTRNVTSLRFPTYVRYDAELGWAGTPNVILPDAFGPGISVRTNGQGLREDRNIGATVAPGHVRIICSGDSFTFGEGVVGDRTWCHLLTGLNPRLETVNMGQGGYGVDQAYLWYKRDGARLQHQLHLFAFITEDLDRMRLAEFNGYPKPYLAVQDGELIVRNVPVPRNYFNPRRIDFRDLRLAELIRRLTRPFTEAGNEAAPPPATRNARTRELLHHVISELEAANEAQGSRLVLVYLPTSSDEEEGAHESLAFFGAEARALQVPLIDLVTPFAALPHAQHTRMFIPNNGHLTIEGNELVARLVYRSLETDAASRGLLTTPQ